jgi:hypothetical protein
VYLYEVVGIAVFTPWGTPRYAGTFYLLPLIIAAIIIGQTSNSFARKRRIL